MKSKFLIFGILGLIAISSGFYIYTEFGNPSNVIGDPVVNEPAIEEDEEPTAPTINEEIEENTDTVELVSTIENAGDKTGVLVTAEFILPYAINGSSEFVSSFNDYYSNIKSKILEYVNYEEFDSAVIRRNDNPDGFLSSTYSLESIVEFEDKNLLSISRFETRFNGGSRISHQIFSEVFKISDGSMLLLSDLVLEPNKLVDYISENLPTNGDYFDDANELVYTLFDPEKYYLTEDSIVVFYDTYDLAPSSSGVPIFEIPYSEIIDNLQEEYKYLGEI